MCDTSFTFNFNNLKVTATCTIAIQTIFQAHLVMSLHAQTVCVCTYCICIPFNCYLFQEGKCVHCHSQGRWKRGGRGGLSRPTFCANFFFPVWSLNFEFAYFYPSQRDGFVWGVYNRWTGLVDWIGGLDWTELDWTGLDWTAQFL